MKLPLILNDEEIRLVLAMIVQHYNLLLTPSVTIDRQVKGTMSPKYGMPMTVDRRDGRLTHTEVRSNIHEMVDLR